MNEYRKLLVHESNGKDYEVKLAKNQKVVQIHKLQGGVNYEANFKAMKALSSNGYVLYNYLMMHNDDRIWALSKQDVFNRTNLTERVYHKAVAELIEKGYLEERGIDTMEGVFKENAYHAWEDPSNKIEKPLPFRVYSTTR